MKYVPNILSIFRFFSAFAIAHFVLKNQLLNALVLFILAALSDFLDGYLARKFDISSLFGAQIDPIADKTLLIISYISLAKIKLIFWPLSVLVVSRDIFIMGVILFCFYKNINLEFNPLFSSKLNTCIQLSFIILVLISKAFNLNILDYLINISAFIVALSTLYSSFDYILHYKWLKDEFFNKKI